MNEFEKQRLLVDISKMYYEHDLSQLEISKKMGISRTYISKLLSEAREQGIVQISINDPSVRESALEKSLRKKYSLRRALIIPAKDSDPALPDRLGSAAAEHLNNILRDGDTIATSWGSTLHAFSRKIVGRDGISGVRTVQLCGGVTRQSENVYAGDIPKNIAQALDGSYYMIPLPAVLDNASAKNTLMRDKNIHSVMTIARNADIAIFSTGAFEEKNLYISAGYFSAEDISLLSSAGAVGDICSHIIDENGQLCDTQLEKRIIALTMEEIAAIPSRMCIAAGENKRACLPAALKTGCINILVTNEEMAEHLLEQS